MSLDIETPVLGLPHRDSFCFSPSSPGTPLTKNFAAFMKANQSQGEMFFFVFFSFKFASSSSLLYKSHLEADVQEVISQTRLQAVQIWLLGCTLPTVFTRPIAALPNSPSINGIVLMDPRTFINRMVRIKLTYSKF